MSRTRATHVRAALLMLGSTVAFALMAVTIRLASRWVPITEVAFFRNAFGLLSLLPIVVVAALRTPVFADGLRTVTRTRQLPRYALRCLIGLASMLCGFWAIGNLPLALAISLSYTSPIFVTVLAVLLLGERVRLRRWMAVLVGFLGVLTIVRPWSQAFSPGTLIAVFAAVLGALVAIQIKQLSRVDSPLTIVWWTYLFWVPMSLVPALAQWQAPHGIAWLWLVLCGVLGTLGQLLWTRALEIGEVSALTPISFLQLPIVATAGVLLFGERLDRWTVIGASIILAANAYIAHREAQLARRNAARTLIDGVEPGN